MLIDSTSIKSAVAYCVGEGIAIYWDGEPETPMATVPYIVAPAGACRVRASVRSIVQIGEDDFRQEFNETTEFIETTVSGNRLFTLSIRVEADAREEAYETAERVRTRLRFRAVHDILKAASVSIASVEAIQSVDFSWDNRDISACILDIRLNVASNDKDADVTFIETVNTTNEVEGPLYTPAKVNTATNMSGTVAISGSGFLPGALAVINGATIVPALVEPTLVLLTAQFSPGTYDVTVVNMNGRTSGSSGAGKLTVT